MTREMWDREAADFDLEPDHGLADPEVRAAWRHLLLGVLPAPPGRVADLGCGTGTLSRLLVDEGYDVDGLDYSPEMVRRARAKVPEASIAEGDASDPRMAARAYDAVLSRHVLWALPDPTLAVARWVELLRPGGTLVLVEGRWATGAGLTALETETLVRPLVDDIERRDLPDPIYWGREISDERYLVVARVSG